MDNNISIIVGEDNSVIGALTQLQRRLNDLLSKYNYINSVRIYIDKNERYYAIQMLERKS